MDDVAKEMKKNQTEFMNQDVFQSRTTNADRREKGRNSRHCMNPSSITE
jgi:hypothetical protein